MHFVLYQLILFVSLTILDNRNYYTIVEIFDKEFSPKIPPSFEGSWFLLIDQHVSEHVSISKCWLVRLKNEKSQQVEI